MALLSFIKTLQLFLARLFDSVRPPAARFCVSSCSACESPTEWHAFISLIHQKRVRSYKGRTPLSGCPYHTWITLLPLTRTSFPACPWPLAASLAISLGPKEFSFCSLHVDPEGDRYLTCARRKELTIDRGSVLCNLVQSCRHTESFQPFSAVSAP